MSIIRPSLLFPNVEEALAPLSAGTETKICIVDCSGNTISIVPPHPTWTNEQGKAVVLLDAVALGGMNGLNS
jgi:hypothetical protein